MSINAMLLLSALFFVFAQADTVRYFVDYQKLVPKKETEGQAYEKDVFDDAGNLISESAWDTEGKPACIYYNTHEYCYTYKGKNLLSITRRDIQGEKVADDKGIYSNIFTYDKWGNPTSESYWGVNGEPRALPWGVHRSESTFDNKHREISYRGYNVEEKPLMDEEGYFRYEIRYNDSDRSYEQAYFGVNDEPVIMCYGFHIFRCHKDKRGRILEDSVFGLAGEPVLRTEGYHRAIRTFDGKDNCTSEKYYDMDGNEVTPKWW